MSVADYELRRVNRGAQDNANFVTITGLLFAGFVSGLILAGVRDEWWFIAGGIVFALVFGGLGLGGFWLHAQVHYQRGYLDGRKGVFKP